MVTAWFLNSCPTVDASLALACMCTIVMALFVAWLLCLHGHQHEYRSSVTLLQVAKVASGQFMAPCAAMALKFQDLFGKTRKTTMTGLPFGLVPD